MPKEAIALTILEVNNFVAATFQKAAIEGDQATFKRSLRRLKRLYQQASQPQQDDDPLDSDNKSREE